MDFIKELSEARLTKDSFNQKKLTYTDCLEKAYLIFLAIEAMRKFPSATPFIREYSKDSINPNYKHFKISGTDLYNLLYFINGDEHALGKLKDPSSAQEMQDKVVLPLRDIETYLTSISKGNNPNMVQQFFIRLENSFLINDSNYKNIRRSFVNFDKINVTDKKAIITKLLFSLRAKLRDSDIIEKFSNLVSEKGLESDKVPDTEPTFSKPDLSSIENRFINYRLLLDKPENIFFIKKFLELSRDGKSIPSQYVAAYLPIIKIVDDIVNAGAASISLLLSLQKRTKNDK